MKNRIYLTLVAILGLLFISCAEDNNPIDTTPDWSKQIQGTWAGSGYNSKKDTMIISFTAVAVKNVISGNADLKFNDEETKQYTMTGTINNQSVAINFSNSTTQINLTATFLATNSNAMSGMMTSTSFENMLVSLTR